MTELAAHLAQLRHLYAQMVSGQVHDTDAAARGLLGPTIKGLERLDRRMTEPPRPEPDRDARIAQAVADTIEATRAAVVEGVAAWLDERALSKWRLSEQCLDARNREEYAIESDVIRREAEYIRNGSWRAGKGEP